MMSHECQLVGARGEICSLVEPPPRLLEGGGGLMILFCQSKGTLCKKDAEATRLLESLMVVMLL